MLSPLCNAQGHGRISPDSNAETGAHFAACEASCDEAAALGRAMTRPAKDAQLARLGQQVLPSACRACEAGSKRPCCALRTCAGQRYELVSAVATSQSSQPHSMLGEHVLLQHSHHQELQDHETGIEDLHCEKSPT